MEPLIKTKQVENRAMGRQFVLTFLIGISAGYSFAYLLLTTIGFDADTSFMSTYRTMINSYNEQPIRSRRDHDINEPAHQSEDRSVADLLARKVRVLCWVMTQPINHRTKAESVKATWGKRCNKLVFVSTIKDPFLPAVKLPVEEGREYLWAKTKAAFRYVYEHHRREADWFMKAEDDTYVVVENLRFLLAEYDPRELLYFGCLFKPFIEQEGSMSGGAGYVLSRAALDRFVNTGLPSPHLCSDSDTGSEDGLMGVCLERLGVNAINTRDSTNRSRFFPFTPEHHFFPDSEKNMWYWQLMNFHIDKDINCCSDRAITFHHITPPEMQVMDYLIYHLRPYGIKYAKDSAQISVKNTSGMVADTTASKEKELTRSV